MTLGDSKSVDLYFNDNKIEQVTQYKYSGNILKSIDNLIYLLIRTLTYVTKAERLYLACSRNKGKFYHLHQKSCPNSLVLSLPISTYVSDVWGHRKSGLDMVDKVMLRYCRRSVQCTISTMCYMNRLYHILWGTIAKQVYEELNKLHSMGFTTWDTGVNQLIINHGMDITATNCHRILVLIVKPWW